MDCIPVQLESLEQKHVQSIFVYGDSPGYLSLFLFFFFLEEICLYLRITYIEMASPSPSYLLTFHNKDNIPVAFSFSEGEDRQVTSSPT